VCCVLPFAHEVSCVVVKWLHSFLMICVTLICGLSFVTEEDLERCKFLCVYVITVTAAAVAKFGSSV
jgi:uncharacterized phage infection (PIP) family protein YhgE